MAGKVLLDTNIIRVIAGDRDAEARLLQSHVFCCPTVSGELYYGAYKSTRVAENLIRVQRFLEALELLQITTATSRFYGEIKNRLRAAAHPIPENDIWIAAHAIEHRVHLATTDSHFKHVDNLLLELW